MLNEIFLELKYTYKSQKSQKTNAGKLKVYTQAEIQLVQTR